MSRIDDLIAELCPDGVDFKTLGETATRITDGSHNPPKASFDGVLYPMLSAKNINNGRVDFIDARMLSAADFEVENRRTNVSPGDVLLTIVGAIGRVAVVETDVPMVFQRSVCLIKLRRDVAEPRFVRYAIEKSSFRGVLPLRPVGPPKKVSIWAR